MRASDVGLSETGTPVFTLHANEGSIEVELPIPGRHNVYNALAAAAVGLYLEVSLEDIAAD